MTDRWEPVPVPKGDGRHDIGDETRAAIFHRLHDDFTLAAPWMTAEQRRQLAMLAAASVRALLHELGALADALTGQEGAAPSPRAEGSTTPVPMDRVREVSGAFMEGYTAGFTDAEAGNADDREDAWAASKASAGLLGAPPEGTADKRKKAHAEEISFEDLPEDLKAAILKRDAERTEPAAQREGAAHSECRCITEWTTTDRRACPVHGEGAAQAPPPQAEEQVKAIRRLVDLRMRCVDGSGYCLKCDIGNRLNAIIAELRQQVAALEAGATWRT